MKCYDPTCGHKLSEHYELDELGPINPDRRRPCRRCGCWAFTKEGEKPFEKPKSIQLNPRNGYLEARYGRPFHELNKADIHSVDDFKKFFAECQPCAYVLRGFTIPNEKVNQIMADIEDFLAPLEKNGGLEPVGVITELTTQQVNQLSEAVKHQFKLSE